MKKDGSFRLYLVVGKMMEQSKNIICMQCSSCRTAIMLKSSSFMEWRDKDPKMTANDWERLDATDGMNCILATTVPLSQFPSPSRSFLLLSGVALGVVAKALNRAHECNGNSLKASSPLSSPPPNRGKSGTNSQHARGGGRRILSV